MDIPKKLVLVTGGVLLLAVLIGVFVYSQLLPDKGVGAPPSKVALKRNPGYEVVKTWKTTEKDTNGYFFYVVINPKLVDVTNKDSVKKSALAIAKNECRSGPGCSVLIFDTKAAADFQLKMMDLTKDKAAKMSKAELDKAQKDLADGWSQYADHFVATVMPDLQDELQFQYYPAKQMTGSLK